MGKSWTFKLCGKNSYLAINLLQVSNPLSSKPFIFIAVRKELNPNIFIDNKRPFKLKGFTADTLFS